MKNQYFGDVNDYRKYGLLRGLAGEGEVRIGVCWMLTPNDHRPDGEKTEYLKQENRNQYGHFDAHLYDYLCRKVHDHETEEQSRDVRHFSSRQLPGAQFWTAVLADTSSERQRYFQEMWKSFTTNKCDVIFFDPDDGLANNNKSRSPLKKGHKYSSKKLFRDEVKTSLDIGFSVLLYQHFDRTPRTELVTRLGTELARMTDSGCAFSFWTPHVVFFLAARQQHVNLLRHGVKRLATGAWAAERSAPTSRKNDRRQILIGEHKAKRETTA